MLNFTERAQEVVRSYLSQDDAHLDALRIAVQGGSPLAEKYELTLVERSEQTDDEREIEGPGFPVFVKEADAPGLEGATVDFVERVEGPIADRVREVLGTQVNPAIASHGGMISLVDVDGTEVYVEMSGGCQGCALSRMTLRQGVERMLRQSVPELTAVHDVTDHDSGANPYFQH